MVNTHLTSIIGGGKESGFPYETVDDFYRWASCGVDGGLNDIRVPLLCINADDDPIVSCLPISEIRFANSPSSPPSSTTSSPVPEEGKGGWVAMIVTKGGGHLGWFDGEAKRRWISKPLVQWVRACAEEVVWPSPSAGTGVEEDALGFMRMKGRSTAGYRVISEGGDAGLDGNGGDATIPGALAGL